ncbi:uncharacterized protein PV07_02693 [Cladophialophora immunda]|uniref:Uncharacterized protein n=1 Tax=Cladophialophora immunda TaxID=569365 RepID=A0A0D2CIT8_9EURO|nr:uncharacterized protein PV07_02693 [Cladophialophora immunda]KIW31008.1 hypothetical protein PV07_02693 [Cladophialophora immunda]OQV05696.1 hypothetical protein CLAIMM_10387 isoform 2 [Cladophialophora immunda]
MRSIKVFSFPGTLTTLRKALEVASQAIQCEYCPRRFLSAMQIAQLVGVLLISVTECYAKILETFEASAASVREGNIVRIQLLDPRDQSCPPPRTDLDPHHESYTFTLNLGGPTWKELAKMALKAEIFGSKTNDENGQPPLSVVSLLQCMEQRQISWHTVAPPPDFPVIYRGSYHKECPTCLLLVYECRRLLSLYDQTEYIQNVPT